MKELLTEFLATILNEAGREFKTVRKGKDGKERVVPFGSKESMQKAIATPSTDGATYRPYNPATDGKLEKEPGAEPVREPAPAGQGYGKDFIGKQGRGITPPVQTTLQTPQSTEKVTDAVRARIKTGLGKIISVLTNRREKGIAGAGGATASQGESLFTQFGNALSEKNGTVGVLELARETTGFGDVTAKYSGNDIVKGDALVGDKRKLTSLKNIRRTIAKDFGWDEYDDEDEENRRVIAEYLALRETYVNNKVEEAKLACTEGTDHVFCKKGKAGFVIVWSRWIKRNAWAYFHPYCVRYAPATPNHGDNIDQYYVGVEMQVHEWRFESLLLLGSIFGSWLFPCLPPCSVSLLDPVCVLSVQTMRSGTSCMRGSRRSFCPAMFSWQSVRRRHA